MPANEVRDESLCINALRHRTFMQVTYEYVTSEEELPGTPDSNGLSLTGELSLMNGQTA